VKYTLFAPGGAGSSMWKPSTSRSRSAFAVLGRHVVFEPWLDRQHGRDHAADGRSNATKLTSARVARWIGIWWPAAAELQRSCALDRSGLGDTLVHKLSSQRSLAPPFPGIACRVIPAAEAKVGARAGGDARQSRSANAEAIAGPDTANDDLNEVD
jgi:hypothetical protein